MTAYFAIIPTKGKCTARDPHCRRQCRVDCALQLSTMRLRSGSAAAGATAALLVGASSAALVRWRVHDQRELSSVELESARQRHETVELERDGVMVLRNAITPSEVARWRAVVLTATAPGAPDVSMSSTGRSHVVLRRRSSSSSGSGHDGESAQLRVDLMRLIASSPQLGATAAAYFAKSSSDDDDQTPARIVKRRASRVVISQLQLLDAAPHSMHQIWHRDNAKRGLTAIIALDAVGANGPTELLLGSHTSAVDAALRSEPPLLGALVHAGDALVYDARVLHRGRGFGTGARRPVLVCRWDEVSSPAPGVGALGTLAQRAIGASLSFILAATSWRG